MIYNAVVFVYMLLSVFPCIGEQEKAAVELLVNLTITFNVELGRIVLAREQYEKAQELLPQLLVLTARHNLTFPIDSSHKPSFMNISAILQAIVYPLMGNLSLASRLEIYATEEEARQMFKLSLERLQAAVDAWVCENSEIALTKSTTPTPVDEHIHNLTARGHGDIWWHSPCISEPRTIKSSTRLSSTPLTEDNLQKHNTAQRPQLASNFLSIPPHQKRLESTPSPGVSHAASTDTRRRRTGSRPSNLIPTWTKYFSFNPSREFSISTHSFGPQTPRDFGSPQASWGYQASVGTRALPWGDTPSEYQCPRVLPWDDADDEVLDDDEMSVDMYKRPHARGHKATEATFGRKLVRRLKAVLNAIRS